MRKEIIFRCDCGHPGVFCLERSDWFGKGSILVELIDKPKGLTYRIKKALIYILKGGKLFYKDIILSKKDVERLKYFLNKV